MPPAQENSNDNGEGSSSSAAAATTNPPPAPTPQTGEDYLKGYKSLPRLIEAILEFEEEIARIPQRLRNLPIQRELSFNEHKDPRTLVKFDPRNNSHIGTVKPHYNVTAMLVFVTGKKLEDDEACCGVRKCMKGIFDLCIVPAEDDEEMTSIKACANCQYDGMGSKCPLQMDYEKEMQEKRDQEQQEREAEEEDVDMDEEEIEEDDDSDDSDFVG